MSEKSNPLEGRTKYITVQEAADHLRVSQSTIYRWIKIGSLKAFQTGYGATRIAVAELQRFIDANTGLAKKKEE